MNTAMPRHSLRTLGQMLGLLLIVAAAPAMAASQPTLYTLASASPKILAQGAQKSWPITISEDAAFDAIFQGGMWLPTPSGGRIYAKYQRHILHDNGTWTWVGTVSTVHGDQSVVLTFGDKAVFGMIPQASGYPLRVVTNAGETRVVETSAAMSRSTQQLKLHSKSDYFVAPRPSAQAGSNRLSLQAAASAPVRAAASSGTVTIDVMVAYTPGFVSALGGQGAALVRIQYLVDLTNQAYVSSGVNQQIRLVNTVEVNYPDNTSNDSALDDVTGLDTDGNPVSIPASLQGIASLRVQYGADLVALIRSYDNATQDNCGVGWLIGGDQSEIDPSQSNAYGYSVVSDGSSGGYYCLDTTFAHELGHNMGDAHDRANATESGAYSYSYGYLGNGTNGFSTIMAYGTDTDTPLSLFSNPDISTCQNTPCGVADSSASSADNAHSMNNTASLIAQFEPTKVGLPLSQASDYVRDDVNGDGHSDLLWMNTGTRSFGYWLMNGSRSIGTWAATVAAGYRVVATGDFNGDGRADLVWEGTAGDLYLWTSNGTSFTSQFIGDAPSGSTVVGAGDLNRDGDSDLLFLNSQAGTFTYWLMNGANAYSRTTQQVAAGYTIGAIGDFNADGRADIVWTSAARDLYLWTSTGSGFTAAFIGTYPSGWTLVGAGDVNGDGISDLLWRNQGAGLFGYWIMRGAKQVTGQAIAAASNYSIASIGDFNGDGKVDVIWTSAARDLYLWTSTGSGFTSQYVGTYPTGWSAISGQLMSAGKP